MASEYRLDDLAREAGVASTTVRLYRTKGLLPAPRMVGRTGWYDEAHLSRLRLIGRLQSEGHSLAGIADLFDQWERGRSLDAVIGVEAGLDALLGAPRAVELDPVELLAQFPDGSLTPDAMQRAVALGVVTPTDDGRFRIPDRRFLDTGAALVALGLPSEVVLDEWETLIGHTDEIAARFIGLFETHLAPDDWETDLDDAQAIELAGSLVKLQATAREVLVAALDASLARLGRERLGSLIRP